MIYPQFSPHSADPVASNMENENRTMEGSAVGLTTTRPASNIRRSYVNMDAGHYMTMDSSGLFREMRQSHIEPPQRHEHRQSVADRYLDRDWFYGCLSRQDAETKLLTCGQECTFLIRESTTEVSSDI